MKNPTETGFYLVIYHCDIINQEIEVPITYRTNHGWNDLCTNVWGENFKKSKYMLDRLISFKKVF